MHGERYIMVSSAERQIKLLLFIQEHEPVSREKIFHDLHEYHIEETTDSASYKKATDSMRRKFIRDKNELEKQGFFIVCDENDLYHVDANASYTVPVGLNDAQASLLRYACCSLLEDPSYLFKEDLRMALIKLSDELDAPDMLPFFNKNTLPASEHSTSDFSRICHAISNRKTLHFSYVDAYGNKSSRTANPFGAYTHEKYFYLVAYDCQRKAQRCFRFDRMSDIHENNKHKSPDFEAEDFNVNDWISLPFQIGDKKFKATIYFANSVAWKAQRFSSHSGNLQQNSNGSCEWSVYAKSIEGLVSWCISNGSGIWPIFPEEAKEVYRHKLKDVLKESA